MASSSIAIRLAAEGGADILRMMQDIGRESQAAFQKAGAAATSATPGVRAYGAEIDKLDGKLNDNSKRRKFGEHLDQVSRGIYEVGSAIPATSTAVMGLTDGLDALAYTAGAGAFGVIAAGAVLAGAALLTLGLGGMKALEQLTKLDEIMRKVGVSTTEIRGLDIVGARNGVAPERSRAAIDNAGGQFEQYKRNSGEVKETIEKIDEDFLKVLDKTRTFEEFWNAINLKIQQSQREEGMDLAKKWLGDESGEKLYDAIMRGELAMQNIRQAAIDAGTALADGPAKAAGELQREIDAAATIATTRLFDAFNTLAPVIAAIKLDFYSMVGHIATMVTEAGKLPQIFKDAASWALQIQKYALVPPLAGWDAGKWVAGKLTGTGADAKDAPKSPFGTLAPVLDAPLPPVRPKPEDLATPAGIARKRYEDRDNEDSGKAAKPAAEDKDKSADVIHALEQQLALTKSVGDAHKEIANQIAIERQLKTANVEADSEQGRKIADLVRQIDSATEATRRQKEAQDAVNRATGQFSQMAASGFADIILDGKKFDDVLGNIEKRLARMAIDSLFKDMFSGIFGGGKSGGDGIFSSIFSSIFGIPKMAEGGAIGAGMLAIGGEAGPEILTRPTLVRGPAAFAPVSKLGGGAAPSIGVVINNNHSGADVGVRQTREGIEVMVDRKIAGAFGSYDGSIEGNLREKTARGW